MDGIKYFPGILCFLLAINLQAQKKQNISPGIVHKYLKKPGGANHRVQAPGCDTINYPIPASWTLTYYVAGSGGSDGFVTGNNIYDDREKGAYFNVSSSADTYLTKVWIAFALANTNQTANLTKTIPIKIYEEDAGKPGVLLATANKLLSELHTDATNDFYSEVLFPGGVALPASKKFFVSVDVSNLTWNQADGFDSLAIYSNQPGQSVPGADGFGWEMSNNSIWATFGADWGTDLALLIHPFISTNSTCGLTPFPGITFSGKVYFQGAYNQGTGLMTNNLNTLGILQADAGSQPYNSGSFNYSGSESVPAGFFSTHSDIVDWILIELRNASTPATIVATRAAFVKQDGTLVETDGLNTAIAFTGIPSVNYFVAIRHRNHLGICTVSAIDFSSGTGNYDFTDPAFVTYGTNAQKNENGKMIMWAGNANGNQATRYNGSSNDKNAVLAKVGLSIPNNVLSGYYREDVNLDGKVRYNGASNDKNIILSVVGLTTPNNVITEQIPD